MFNAETSVVINWLNTNTPDKEFYSSADAKAFVAVKLGVSLCEISVEMKDCLIRLGLNKVDWEEVYFQFKQEAPLLSEEDKSRLSSIGKEVYRLRNERAEFLKSKKYKVMKGLYLEQDYWVHESVLDRWDYSSYVMDTNHSKYPNDSVLEY